MSNMALNGNLISEMKQYRVTYRDPVDSKEYTVVILAHNSHEAARPWLSMEVINVERLED